MAIAGFFAPSPRSVLDTFSKEMAERIQETLGKGRYDLVVASQEGTAAYRRYFKDRPAVFEEVEIAVLYERYLKASGLWSRFRNGLTWYKQKRFLSRLLCDFDACTVVSDQESHLLSETVPSLPLIEVIPNCVNLEAYKGLESDADEDQLIFTGSFLYEPNHEAMVWFVRDVYPEIRKRIPGAKLIITGDHANRPMPAVEGVDLVGHVEDVRPLIASSKASLAPIFSGGGTRLKILEAMALGTPVVATSKGAEGLEVKSGEHLLVADTSAEFAAASVQILRDTELRRRLAENAFQLVSRKYDWSAVMPGFLALLDRIVGNKVA